MARRPEYLEQTLASLAGLKGLHRFSVYISQDGTNSKVAEVISRLGSKRFRRQSQKYEHWQRERVPQLGPDQVSHGLDLSGTCCRLHARTSQGR